MFLITKKQYTFLILKTVRDSSVDKIANDSRLGNIFFVDSDELLYKIIKDNGVFEKEEISWLDKNVSSGMVCINVGANIGYHTMILSYLVGNNGAVYSFEPSSINFEILKKNIQSKKMNNVLLSQYAVGDKNGSIDIFINEKNPGDTRCFDPREVVDRYTKNYIDHGFSNKIPKETVNLIKLDDFIEERVDLLFLDTQGYDIFALRGAEQIIKRDKPMICFELVPDWLNCLNIDWKSFIKSYSDYGYSISMIDEVDGEILISNVDSIEYYINKNKRWFTTIAMTYPK